MRTIVLGMVLGVLAACALRHLVLRPPQGTADYPSLAAGATSDRRLPSVQPLSASEGGGPGAASGTSKPHDSLAAAIAAKAAEQKRFIEAASPLQGHGRQLAYAVIGLLREKDVERWIQSGIDRKRQDLNAEIDSAAPIPVIPLGPRLGLAPNQ